MLFTTPCISYRENSRVTRPGFLEIARTLLGASPLTPLRCDLQVREAVEG